MTDTTTQIKGALSVAAADYRYRKEEDHAVNRRHWERREDLMDRALSALSAAQPLEGGEEEIERVITLLTHAKVGTKFARKYEDLTGPPVPSTIGIEFDKDVDAMLLKLRNRSAAHWLRGGQPVGEPVAWMATDGRHVVSKPNYDDMSFISRGGYPIPLGVLPAGQQWIGDKPSVEEIMGVVLDWCCPTKDAEDQLRSRLRSLLDRSAPNSTPA